MHAGYLMVVPQFSRGLRLASSRLELRDQSTDDVDAAGGNVTGS
jgi:hypothetical protein